MSSPIKSSLAKAVAAIKEPAFQKATEKFVEDIAAKVPIITGVKLNGSRPHKSHDDPADPKPVVSFALYKSNKLNSQNRVGIGHVHDDGTGHVNFLPSTSNIVPLREWSTNLRSASPAALGSRSQVAPASRGGQTSRPSNSNGGTARIGLQEIGLRTIKNGVLITIVNGTIGNILSKLFLTSYIVDEPESYQYSRTLPLF